MDIEKLKAYFRFYDDTYAKLADALGINKATACMKMNGSNQFKRDEIEIVIKRYNMKAYDVMEIFFPNILKKLNII